jgi:hypothetical protein
LFHRGQILRRPERNGGRRRSGRDGGTGGRYTSEKYQQLSLGMLPLVYQELQNLVAVKNSVGHVSSLRLNSNPQNSSPF